METQLLKVAQLFSHFLVSEAVDLLGIYWVLVLGVVTQTIATVHYL